MARTFQLAAGDAIRIVAMAKLLVFIGVLTVFQGSAAGQGGFERFLDTVKERNMEELLVAIDTLDGTGFNYAMVSGLLPSGSEPYSRFQQVIRDPRVRKIYTVLKAMPEDEAALIVSAAYDDALSRLKELAGKGAASTPLSYGLHAKLWLSFQFESKEEFNRKFRAWKDWYVDQLVSKSYLNRYEKIRRSMRKRVFADHFGPELLMYLNLVLVDQRSEGETTEFARLLRECGSGRSLERSLYQYELFPIDGTEEDEPLLQIVCLGGWCGLDRLGVEERAKVLTKAQDLVDPMGTLHKATRDLADRMLAGGGFPDDEILREEHEPQIVAIRIRLIGSESKAFLRQGWTPDFLPSKSRVLAAADRMYKLTPPEEKKDWESGILELKSWLSELPETGIHVKGEKVWEWPVPTEEGAKPKRRIQLILNEVHAFQESVKRKSEKDPTHRR